MMINQQQGFTLIELLVALVLGSLIVAAGLAVFLSGQRSAVLQSGMGELQQNANFGLSVLAQDLRHANLNTASTQKINNRLVGSGIIFSKSNLPSSFSAADLDYVMTAQEKDTSAITVASDQLTIQYVPEYRKIVEEEKYKEGAEEKTRQITKYFFNGVDCEGNTLDFDKPRVIVQRYHVKPDTVQTPGLPTSYSLFCDAGSYAEGDDEITGMSSTTNGQQLMQKIDAFKVKLGVKNTNGEMAYVTIKEYLTDLMPETPVANAAIYNVQSVEVALLARSTLPVTGENLINNNKAFKINGEDIKLSTEHVNGPKYLREVFSQVIAFRNTLGAS